MNQTTTEPTSTTPPTIRATLLSDEALDALVADAMREAGIDPSAITPAQMIVIKAAVVAGAHFESAEHQLGYSAALSAGIEDRGILVLADVFRVASAQPSATGALWLALSL